MANTASIFDPRDLAWIAARRSHLSLTLEERELVDGFVKILRDGDHEQELHEGCAPASQLEEAQTLLAAAESELEAIAQLVNVDGSDDVGEAVEKALAAAREEGVKDATVPSRANTAQRKALRLLVDGHVVVQRVETAGELNGLIVAEVKGDSGDVHVLGYDPRRKQWRCTCPELRGQCSHLTALKMITRPPG